MFRLCIAKLSVLGYLPLYLSHTLSTITYYYTYCLAIDCRLLSHLYL